MNMYSPHFQVTAKYQPSLEIPCVNLTFTMHTASQEYSSFKCPSQWLNFLLESPIKVKSLSSWDRTVTDICHFYQCKCDYFKSHVFQFCMQGHGHRCKGGMDTDARGAWTQMQRGIDTNARRAWTQMQESVNIRPHALYHCNTLLGGIHFKYSRQRNSRKYLGILPTINQDGNKYL
jgi:hypothetical protein